VVVVNGVRVHQIVFLAFFIPRLWSVAHRKVYIQGANPIENVRFALEHLVHDLASFVGVDRRVIQGNADGLIKDSRRCFAKGPRQKSARAKVSGVVDVANNELDQLGGKWERLVGYIPRSLALEPNMGHAARVLAELATATMNRHFPIHNMNPSKISSCPLQTFTNATR